MSVYLVGFSCPNALFGDVADVITWYLEGRKKMFYLTTLEENVLFNDAPNTFNLRLYGVGYMVKDLYLGCSFRLTGNYILYELSHRRHSTYHGLC